MINKILSACDFKILTQFSPCLVSDVIQTCCLLSLARSTSCLQGWCHTASWILRGYSHGFTCWILQECQAHTQAQVQVCDHAFVWLHVHSGGQGHVYVWVHAMLFLRSMSVSEPMPIPLPETDIAAPSITPMPTPEPVLMPMPTGGFCHELSLAPSAALLTSWTWCSWTAASGFLCTGPHIQTSVPRMHCWSVHASVHHTQLFCISADNGLSI